MDPLMDYDLHASHAARLQSIQRRTNQQGTAFRLKCMLVIALLVAWQCLVPTRLYSQDGMAIEEPPLIDTPPYDVIVLTAAAGGKSVRIAPIADRNLTQRPPDTTKLEVVLLSHPDRRYEIAWRDIERLDLYEKMILDESFKKLGEKDFIAAFMNLSFLMRNYPKTPNLEKLRRDFLFQSAAAMFGESRTDFSRYFQTLSTLEELRATAPEFEKEKVTNGLKNVTDALLRYYTTKGDLSSAKRLLERLESTYGDSLPSVSTWKAEFLRMAESRKQQAKEFLDAEKFREARQAALDAISISPQLSGAQELLTEIRTRHPMIRVGVMQRASVYDPTNLFSWSSRRAGLLVYQPVMRFLQTGGEGGRYEFALGKTKLSEDHQQLTLTVDPKLSSSLSAFDLTQLLITRATPGSDTYDASWAAVVKTLATPSPTQIIVQLQRPHVLPHALLQFSLLDTPEKETALPGKYRFATVDKNENVFKIRDEQNVASGMPVEVIEVFYEDPKDAVTALLRGEVDLVDQIFPADARKYSQSQSVKLGSYGLPTVHMLIPTSEHPYLVKDKFRRALMYATNREEILRGEILGTSEQNDGRIVSGPFPVGINKNDPLSYAYDETVAPAGYDPRLAKLLLHMVDRDMAAQSAKMKIPIPEKTPLKIGVPDYEVARIAVQGMIEQWSLVGVKAELVQLNDSSSLGKNEQCDLVYITSMMSEPAIDIERLIGGNGPAASSNPFIVQGLTRLRQARSWRDVRTALQDLHRLVDYHLPILPLWQITDKFAYSTELKGLAPGVTYLYQNVESWRLGNAAVAMTPQAVLQ